MDSLLYCSEKAAPFGSAQYYVLLWQAPTLRAQMLAVLALRQELLDIPARVSDGQLALTKLNWWREEIARAARGVAQHPVSVALQPLLANATLTAAELTLMCDAIELLLQTGRLVDETSLEAYCQHIGALPWQLTARLAAPTLVEGQRYAGKIGAGLQLLEMLQHLVAEAQRGVIFAPISMLERHELPVEQLVKAVADERFIALARDMLARSRECFAEARQSMSGRVPAALRYLTAAMAMGEATMSELERAGLASLATQRLTLTPVRKLLIAWKCRWFA